MGIVYRAEDPAIGRTVAVKTIRLGDFADPAERERLRERLFREARSAGALSHPNIVTIYDIAEENDTAYVFMEFVDGQTLEEMLGAEWSLDRTRMLEVLRQTAAALDYAHSKGIVHRDIKPANIMVSVDGQAKITDFGVAKIISQQMTQAGTILGTPNYMSPEQIQGASVDGRSDQFSLGVIAYEMLTGEKPHVADALPTLLFKIAREEPIAPRRLNPSLGPEVDVVLGRTLAKNPTERYPTCSEFIGALTMAVQASPEWQPLKRGAAGALETVLTASDAQPTVLEQRPPAEEAEPPEAGEAEPPVAVLPPRRRRHPLEEKESSPVRTALLGVLAVAVVALGVVAFREYGARDEVAGTESGLEQQAPVETPRAAAPPPAARAEPPVQAAPVKPVEIPAAVPEPPPAIAGPPKTEPSKVEAVKRSSAKPVPAAPKPQPVPPSPAEYSVALQSDPPDAMVVTDRGGASCRAPCNLLLREGRHLLTASLAGYRVATKVIHVPDELSATLPLERMAGTLVITSSPPGATILVNGQRRPEATPARIELPIGTYKVTVAMEGRTPSEDTVQVRDKMVATIKVEW
jgi:hypothetical protein